MNNEQNLKNNTEIEKTPNNQIEIDDLKKVEIKIGEILKAEKIEKSKKLLVLQVDFGDHIRQIVSGISQYFLPENLIGKKVAFATNLKPRELMGYQSNGMIFAAKDENKNFSLLEVSKEIKNGTCIS